MNYFLVIFIDFFIFFEFKFKFEFLGSYRWVPLPYPKVGAVTAIKHAVPSGKKISWVGTLAAGLAG
jgi:hypothetical protein